MDVSYDHPRGRLAPSIRSQSRWSSPPQSPINALLTRMPASRARSDTIGEPIETAQSAVMVHPGQFVCRQATDM
jgi:hypothetical protein